MKDQPEGKEKDQPSRKKKESQLVIEVPAPKKTEAPAPKKTSFTSPPASAPGRRSFDFLFGQASCSADWLQKRAGLKDDLSRVMSSIKPEGSADYEDWLRIGRGLGSQLDQCLSEGRVARAEPKKDEKGKGREEAEEEEVEEAKEDEEEEEVSPADRKGKKRAREEEEEEE